MEKRVLLAVILSFIVLYGYQALLPPPPKPTPAGQSPPKTAAPQNAPQATTPGGAAPSAPALEAPAPAAPSTLVADTAEREIIVENDSIRGVLSTRGGVLKSWRLKKY